jgi:anti-sigma regulatory factor (Ser/Thr protein kinase)
MAVSVWATRPPPPPSRDRTPSWQGRPIGIAALAELRRLLCTALTGGVLPSGSDDGERLLLVVEELASNALRHGRPPVRVAVAGHHLGWLVTVSDTAPERPPVPALDRDPAQGGMGLSLVARLCGTRGWTVEDDHKIVWARVPYLEHFRAERLHAARARALALAAQLTETEARVAELLDALAVDADATGRPDAARRFRSRATRARLEANRARWAVIGARERSPSHSNV